MLTKEEQHKLIASYPRWRQCYVDQRGTERIQCDACGADFPAYLVVPRHKPDCLRARFDREHAEPASPSEPQVGDLWWVPGQSASVRRVRSLDECVSRIGWDGVAIFSRDTDEEWQSWVASGAVLLHREGGT